MKFRGWKWMRKGDSSHFFSMGLVDVELKSESKAGVTETLAKITNISTTKTTFFIHVSDVSIKDDSLEIKGDHIIDGTYYHIRLENHEC